MGDMLVVKAKLKDVCKGFNVAGDLAEGLSGKVGAAVDDAVKRADGNGRKTVMGKDVPFCFECSEKHGESLIVKAKLKEAAKGANVAGDLAESLNCYAHQLLKAACERAESNQRKTVMAKDL
ncbi:histone-like protein [Nanoarchaeota archaeon]